MEQNNDCFTLCYNIFCMHLSSKLLKDTVTVIIILLTFSVSKAAIYIIIVTSD